MSEMAFQRVPIKYIADVLSGGTPRSNPENWDGEVPFITPPDLNGLDGAVVENWGRTLTEVGAKSGSTVTENAVLISCRAPVGHIGTVKGEVSFNQGCKSVAPLDVADLSFISKCLVADRTALQSASRGTTFTELSTTELLNHAIPWPKKSKRLRIADYLDRETSQIDAMIDKLGELESDLDLRKDSVVKTELIDEEHKYPRVPLQAIASIHSGDTISASKIEKTGEYPVYGGNGVRGFTKNYNESQNRVLIGRQGALCGNVHQAVAPFWASEHALVLSPYDDVDLRWLEYATRNLDLGRLSTSAAQPGITASGVGRERLPLPPLEEQRRIADHLDDVTSKIDTMLAKVAELKDLLTERRAALITDVVTGRKDVA